MLLVPLNASLAVAGFALVVVVYLMKLASL
jgi:hypothetical protein